MKKGKVLYEDNRMTFGLKAQAYISILATIGIGLSLIYINYYLWQDRGIYIVTVFVFLTGLIFYLTLLGSDELTVYENGYKSPKKPFSAIFTSKENFTSFEEVEDIKLLKQKHIVPGPGGKYWNNLKIELVDGVEDYGGNHFLDIKKSYKKLKEAKMKYDQKEK